ncbi:MAG: hypothetical protein UMU76_08630 [Prosthecochloris sp.]|nr:hypothetical protein [Prosthecochloris sp.]
MVNHFYARYGLALTMLNNRLDSPDEVTPEMLISELENGQNRFRLEPLPFKIENDSVEFRYLSKDYFRENKARIGSQGKSIVQMGNDGSAVVSYFLAPTIITSNKGAGNAWKAVSDTQKELKGGKFFASKEATMSLMPLSGKINNGKQSQSNAKSSLIEVASCAITTFTPHKPALLPKLMSGETDPACIIPDLALNDLRRFIHLFQKMSSSGTKKLLMGKVKTNKKKTETVYIFQRPKICSGNFPYAPRQSALGSVGLLGAIGRWAKEANYWVDGKRVLESLKSRPIYIVEYGNAKSVSYGHWIVELAKEDFLCDIIDAVQYSQILSEEKRDLSSPKYQLFFLFASRFFQLFEQKSFQDFLSIRAEYPQELEKLFNTYFINAMQKDETVVHSARALGHWLNSTAYWAALKEAENRDKQGDKEMIRKLKAKFLAEMESTVFAAKSHDALLAQVVTRAGRLSQSDAPNAATLFFDAVAAGKLTLEESKNLIVAYSRLRSTAENNEQDFSSEPPDLGNDSASDSE